MPQIALRPQPFGIFPPPVSYLALPAVSDADAALASLMRGHIPADLPPSWRFFSLALAGNRDEALIALAGDSSPLARYNRFVLSGSPSDYAARAAVPPGDLAMLFDVAAYTLGYREIPPDPAESEGELRALIMMAWGSAAMERGDLQAAEADVGVALALARDSSPLLAAQLALALAEMRTERIGPDPSIFQYLREAMDLLQGSGLSNLYAQVALSLGARYQDLARIQRDPLVEAVKCYQEALRVFTPATHPELYARAQHNLALSYLAMPMVGPDDRPHIESAAQALRAALTVYTRQQYPEQWAGVSLVLAGALQQIPSMYPANHLSDAVVIYEDLLAFRCPQVDPLGYARLLARLGGVLVRLGDVAQAAPRLDQAHQLFSQVGDRESAAMIAATLAGLGNAREMNGPVPLEEWPFEIP